MTTRIHRLLAACAAAAIVVPTVALAQQPTMLQLYNLNGSAVGGRWLVRPPALPNTGGPYTITLPDASGTLLTGSGTANRMTRWTGTGTLGNGSLDDDASGTLSRAGNININPGGANTLATNGNLSAGGGLTITGASNLNGSATIGNGDDNVAINAGAANTFQLTSNGLNVATNGDLSDAGGAVVINDADGLDLNNNLIVNVGNAGTDFTAGGGLTLAGALVANGAATLGNGDDNVAINAGAANTFQLTSNGLNVATNGDLSDAGGAVVINDLQGLDMSNSVIANIGAAGTDFSGTGGLTLADALTVSAGGATITGATDINNSAAALTTAIGNNTVGNTVSINSAVVNMANLPAGAASDALITTDGTALYETSAATIIGNTAWLIGNNTFTAASATRTIGIAAQAGSEDAFEIQTDGVARMTFGGTGGITAATTLDMNNNVITNIGVAGTDFTATGGLNLADPLVIDEANNQIVLDGGAFSITINAPAPGADRTYTIPDALAAAQFVLTEGTQTINTNLSFAGNLNYTSALILGSGPLVFEGSSVDATTTTFQITDPSANRNITFPDASGTVLLNSGSGRVNVEEGVDGTDVFTITNPTVTSNSVIVVTLEDDTDLAFYDVKVGNRVANTSFDVILSAPLGAGLTKWINYTIINP